MGSPANLLVYYGWLNSFNSSVNQWNNEKVAHDLARYDVLVFGDGVQNPSHGDYSNTQVIIPRIKELNPEGMIFGYVTVNQKLSDFITKADQWEDLEVDGIFMDEAGYDYGKNRSEFNERVIHVHSKEHANTCFANAWNIDNVLGTENDPSYPNSTFNPNLYESQLNEDDLYMLESFSVNTDSYTSSNGFAPKADWKARGEKAVQRREKYGIGLAAAGIIADGDSNGQTLFDFCHRAAQAFDLDANGSSDSNYGASSAASKLWERPDPKEMDQSACLPSVSVDPSDADVFYRQTGHARIKLDFSSGNETSEVTEW